MREGGGIRAGKEKVGEGGREEKEGKPRSSSEGMRREKRRESEGRR